MTNSQRLATVRNCFLRWMSAEIGQTSGGNDDSDGPQIQTESVLIRDEFFCGRRFRAATHRAVWFIEEDTLKIFDNQNVLQTVMRSGEIDEFVGRVADADPVILAIPRPQQASTGVRRAA
ncbi:hypothetical protein Poly51_46170 [Rubripirellula tenax]|uniref:Uncharacterized protein n=1 Tax=Rubripirellula tenax TaxID=2528015 RepID=A0A5C6EJX7_9BACT|nr:hypothetical protein [Rubripirellula tenax]TWU48715.1 hypothetical protein Poly51_46170 [Rubripirellula tenax]